MLSFPNDDKAERTQYMHVSFSSRPMCHGTVLTQRSLSLVVLSSSCRFHPLHDVMVLQKPVFDLEDRTRHARSPTNGWHLTFIGAAVHPKFLIVLSFYVSVNLLTTTVYGIERDGAGALLLHFVFMFIEKLQALQGFIEISPCKHCKDLLKYPLASIARIYWNIHINNKV